MFKKFFAKLPLILLAAVVLAALSYTQTGSENFEKFLPPDTAMFHLTGESNNGLWNSKMKLSVANEEDTYIIVESQTPFSAIEVGDIVLFTEEKLGAVVCHPVIEKGIGFLKTKGFNNKSEDAATVYPQNYKGRVVQISDNKDGPWKKVPKV